jgi:hypothetical protein
MHVTEHSDLTSLLIILAKKKHEKWILRLLCLPEYKMGIIFHIIIIKVGGSLQLYTKLKMVKGVVLHLG